MKRELREALAVCLARLEAGESVEACLRGHEALAAELRPLLAAASAVRDFPVEPYSPEGFQGGRARLRSAVRSAAERRPPGLPMAWQLMRPAAALAVATVVAALALLALTTDVFRFGAGQTEAVEGVVESVEDGTWIINTRSGTRQVKVGPDTPVLGGDTSLTARDVTPGTQVIIQDDDDDGAAEGIFVEEEFEGTVTGINGSDLTVQTSTGPVVVRRAAHTEVEGTLAVGAAVKVRATWQDGVYVAREIKVLAATDTGGGGDDDGGGSGGPGGGESGGSGGPGGGDN